MDKTEYKIRLDELTSLVSDQDYKGALQIVESIDWRRVKSVKTLGMVADVYERNKDYKHCKEILMIAHKRSAISKMVLYRLVEVSLRLGDIEDAKTYYSEFVDLAPHDNSRYILKYKLYKAQKAPLEDQISVLEEYKDREYTERWAYELARLYNQAGEQEKCVEICDDLVLWFGEGRYVKKALELKEQHQPLTVAQQQVAAGVRVSNPFAESKATEDFLSTEELLQKMDQAGAAVTQEASTAMEQMSQAEADNEEKLDKVPVISKEFLGKTADLREQLAKSIQEVFYGMKKPEETDEEAIEAIADEFLADSEIEQTPEAVESEESEKTEEVIEAIADEFLADSEAEQTPEAVVSEEPAVSEELKVTEEQEQEELEVRELEPETIEEDTIVTPEPVERIKTKTEPARETVSDATMELATEQTLQEMKRIAVPQDTIPMSIEEVLREETPEERRIRILTEEKPEKFTDEQKALFSYFAKVPGMDQQVLEALSGVYDHVTEKTSRHGNVAVMGGSGTGKTRLIESIVRAICKDLGLTAAKYARIDAEELNKKDPAAVVGKMAGGFLMIENAGLLYPEVIQKLNQALEFRTDSLVLIIEDEKTSMRALLRNHPEFAEKFETVISIPVFTNDELVTFARTYARENGYKMDELGILALYTLIGNNQTDNEPVTITKVKDMVDGAIANAGKSTRRFGRRMSRRHTDEHNRIILYEKDFDID